MKRILFLCFISFGFLTAQVERPAKWNYHASKTDVKKGETIELIFEAEVDNGWYMYSVGKFEMAPAATFAFEKNDSYQLVGSVKAIHDKPKDDQYIGKYRYFTEHAEFRQKIKILKPEPVIKGTYEFSTCSSKDGVCLPPRDEEFAITDLKVNGEIKEEKVIKTEIKPVKNKPVDLKEIKAEDKNEEAIAIDALLEAEAKDSVLNAVVSVSDVPLKPVQEESFIGLFLLAFLSGLVALLTPCVFPMIPMTVTFFLNSGKSKKHGIWKALMYGFSIIAIYTVIGTIVSKVAGPEAANFLSTHWIPNLFFFIVFLIFAFSFLGMFEITLPSWLVNASDKQADKGGMTGIFFMAATLVLVSFSCTGPIVGTILVQSAGGATLRPIIGMFGFSLAFAIPFTLFAIFPSWLNSLPKSGGWLNTVKVVLGFLELALAFKFLSLADQAYHWGILDREINIAIWIAIFSGLALYFFGKITLPHDSKLEKIGVPRLVLGIATWTFVIYLIPGMFGAPLKALSGYLPPMKSHDFDLIKIIIANNQPVTEAGNQICEKPKYSEFLELPHGLKGYFAYKDALACAKKLNKPVFIDFTGHGCVNCREMEANVWSDPKVISKLQNDFVVVALYVDDKTELPESQWYTSTYDGKIKKSIGKQNADLQVTKYNNNAQPYYLVVDGDGKTLSGPVTYDKDVTAFETFLDKGLRNHSAKPNN
jgi:thiol:disulfide interchange protein